MAPLSEGVIGAAYSIGFLGTFLWSVLSFKHHGRMGSLCLFCDRPGIRSLVLMGIIAPAILGAWIGGFAPSPTLAVLFLAIGAGAIFQVVYELAKYIQKDTAKQSMPGTVFGGVLAGMMLLWVTGLLIK
jgi:hypothetical protein